MRSWHAVALLVALLVIGGCGNRPSVGVVDTSGSGGDQPSGAAPLDPQHPGPTAAATPDDPAASGAAPAGQPGGAQGPVGGPSGGGPYTPDQAPLTPADLDGFVQASGTTSFTQALRITLGECPTEPPDKAAECQQHVRRVFSLVHVRVDDTQDGGCGAEWDRDTVALVFRTGSCTPESQPVDPTAPPPGPERDALVNSTKIGSGDPDNGGGDPVVPGTPGGTTDGSTPPVVDPDVGTTDAGAPPS